MTKNKQAAAQMSSRRRDWLDGVARSPITARVILYHNGDIVSRRCVSYKYSGKVKFFHGRVHELNNIIKAKTNPLRMRPSKVVAHVVIADNIGEQYLCTHYSALDKLNYTATSWGDFIIAAITKCLPEWTMTETAQRVRVVRTA